MTKHKMTEETGFGRRRLRVAKAALFKLRKAFCKEKDAAFDHGETRRNGLHLQQGRPRLAAMEKNTMTGLAKCDRLPKQKVQSVLKG